MLRASARASAILALLAAVLPLAGPVRAAGPHVWRLLADSAPFPPVFEVPMGVYDPVRQRVLVIDVGLGSSAGVVHAFETSPEPRWSMLETSGGPEGRHFLASVTYDPLRDRLLLIGHGYDGPFKVWALPLLGPATWQELPSSGAPPIDYGHSTVYDPDHDRLILFGGVRTGYPASYSSDTWTYSFAIGRWSPLATFGPLPGGREGHGAMLDPVGHRMIVFGGHYEAAARGFWNDLWSLSLEGTPEWAPVVVDGPVPGARSALATTYDPVRRRMLVHGGVNDQSGVEPDDLWALSLDGAPAWTKIATENSLRGRSYPVDAYDPVGDRLLACGGGGFPQASALSLATPARWSSLLPVQPLPAPSHRSRHAVVHDTHRDRFVVVGGEFSPADSALWRFDVQDPHPWQSQAAPDAPMSLYGFELAPATVYDSLGDRIITFAGSQAFSTPAHGPIQWTRLGPPTPFSHVPVVGSGLALDTRRQRLIVTGGLVLYPHSGDWTIGDVWALPLSGDLTWSSLGTLPQEWGSAGHASFYDEGSDQLVVIGGFFRPGRLRWYPLGSSVWTTPIASGLQWTKHPSPDEVPAPPDARAAFDSRARRALVFQGTRAWGRGVDDSGPWTEFQFTGTTPNVTSPVVYDRLRDQAVALFSSVTGSARVQAWALAIGPLSVSLVSARHVSGTNELQWRSIAAHGRNATLERREEHSDWATRGPIVFDALGFATVTDSDVRAGHDHLYRVAVSDGDSLWHSPPVRINDPRSLRLAVIGCWPHPAVDGLNLSFSLPAEGAARLEIFDVRGRRCFAKDVGSWGPGTHTIPVATSESWRPGVYFARLRRGGASDSKRIVLSR